MSNHFHTSWKDCLENSFTNSCVLPWFGQHLWRTRSLSRLKQCFFSMLDRKYKIFSQIDNIPVSYTLKMHVPGWGILGHHCSLGTSSSIFQWEIERFFTFNLLYYSLDLLVYLPTMIIITFSFFFQLFCLLFIFVGCNCNEPS